MSKITTIPNEKKYAYITSHSTTILLIWSLEIPYFRLEMNIKLSKYEYDFTN
ncbi:hypothetical protein I4U23_005654 [Adineta vaga]|nr:hypothetical protein I4U23_005654 [Adineta vaga]